MMAAPIPNELFQQLEAIAQEEGFTPAELLQIMLSQYPRRRTVSPPPLSLAELAEISRTMNRSFLEPVDTANLSIELLKTEYADYLKRRVE